MSEKVTREIRKNEKEKNTFMSKWLKAKAWRDYKMHRGMYQWSSATLKAPATKWVPFVIRDSI